MANPTKNHTNHSETIDCEGQVGIGGDEEIWKVDPDFPDYEFSNLGRARSFRRGRVRYFKGTPQRVGHLSIELQPGRHQEFLHRVIARLFLGTCPLGMIVCHKNGDSKDNRVVNLAYGTPQQNSIERYQHAGTYTGKRSRFHKRGPRKYENVGTTFAFLTHAIRNSRDADSLTIPMHLAREIAAILEKSIGSR